MRRRKFDAKAFLQWALSEDEDYSESSTKTNPEAQQHINHYQRQDYVYTHHRKRTRPTRNETFHWLKKKKGTHNIFTNPEAPSTPTTASSSTEENTPVPKEHSIRTKYQSSQYLQHATCTPPSSCPSTPREYKESGLKTPTPSDVSPSSLASQNHNQPLPPYFNKTNPNHQNHPKPLPNTNPRSNFNEGKSPPFSQSI